MSHAEVGDVRQQVIPFDYEELKRRGGMAAAASVWSRTFQRSRKLLPRRNCCMYFHKEWHVTLDLYS